MDLSIGKLKSNKDAIDDDLPLLQKQKIIPCHNTGSVIITGAVKSGKSNLMAVLATDYRFYGDYYKKKNRFLFSPTAEFDDMAENMDIPKENRVSEDMIDALQNLYDNQLEKVKAGKSEKLLVICDDLTSCKKFQRSPIFKKIFTTNRHINMMLWCAVHKYTGLIRVCRLQCAYIIFFNAPDSEIKALAEDHTPAGKSKKEMYEIVNYATKKSKDSPKPFLFINNCADHEDRYRRNFNEIIEL